MNITQILIINNKTMWKEKNETIEIYCSKCKEKQEFILVEKSSFFGYKRFECTECWSSKTIDN